MDRPRPFKRDRAMTYGKDNVEVAFVGLERISAQLDAILWAIERADEPKRKPPRKRKGA